MGKDELQKHMDNAMYGTPLLKPAEQKKYMGTFRERCYMTMTITQMKNPENKKNFLNELEKYSEGIILVNGAMEMSLQANYIKEINEKNRQFTVVNDFVSNTPEALGIILAATEAVNEEVIDIEEKYPKQATSKNEKQKAGFWHRLFH